MSQKQKPKGGHAASNYAKRLRQKLGESAEDPGYIFNEPRVGYRLGPPRDEDGEPGLG